MRVGILMAAGASSRMGSSKPLLPWMGTSLIRWELEILRNCEVDEIVVVLGSNHILISQEIEEFNCSIVVNENWSAGRATSLALGAQEVVSKHDASLSAEDAVLIQNVDQPTSMRIVRQLFDTLVGSKANIVQPFYFDSEGQEHGGHPVVVRGDVAAELVGVNEDTAGLRSVMQRHQVERVSTDDQNDVGLHLNTPQSVEVARQIFGESRNVVQ